MTAFKAIVEHSALVKVMGRVVRVVEKRNTIPILSNVLLEVEQDRIRLRATDLDIEMTDAVKAEAAAKGSTTVPAGLLHDVVRKMPAGSQITIEQEGEVVVVKAGRSRFRLQTLPPSDFPNISIGDMTHSFAIQAKDLHRLIKRVQFAISTEETRYYLNGIYLHTHKEGNVNHLRAVATDGHRLASVDVDLPEGAAGMPGVIVPRKTVGEVDRLFASTDGEIQVELSQGKITFTSGDIVLVSKLIDGTFPDYGRVIPQNNEKTLKIGSKNLLEAVDRVATISSERGRAVKVSLAEGKITLHVTNPDAGAATEELEAEFTGDAMEIGFNSRYLHDILAEVQGESVNVNLADPGSPTIFRGTDEGSLYVLMPMRV
ncbi:MULTISPECIES: DNA polymerase III subunit beta [unclassified Bradyrhizobium]|uniref:DNA polymerase III subunit beta n=1 Tax=Bradyrhizobium sp. USDA 4541 TaxID=2817704 RepID=UPI002111713C|nr:DNA polymerase III subunit beta [Bradyrhizobium sp. USDA 4541]MCP1852842.1 DNA polymerase-3 subunit beta [Bradyrhizobium sp. USDA 4541]